MHEESILGETNSIRLRRKLSNISEDILDKASNLAFEFNKGSALEKYETIETLKKDFIKEVTMNPTSKTVTRKRSGPHIELEVLSPIMEKRKSSEQNSFNVEECKKSNTLEPKEL